eukprot:358996-Chlamydomonas_euryale.AAC.9
MALGSGFPVVGATKLWLIVCHLGQGYCTNNVRLPFRCVHTAHMDLQLWCGHGRGCDNAGRGRGDAAV